MHKVYAQNTFFKFSFKFAPKDNQNGLYLKQAKIWQQ